MSNEESERITTSQDVISRLHDKIDELEARLEIDHSHPYDGIAARDATIKAQDERIAELEKDAARYRWLRNRMLGVDFDWCENGITALAFEMPDGCAYGGNCDQNIDAAIAAKAKE